MRKVPVFEVIRYAYRFLFHEFGTIVRLTWFPLLVLAAVQYAVGYQAIEAQVAAGSFDKPVPGTLLWDILTGAISLFAFSMVAVALHRLILFDDRKPGTMLLFSLRRAEWLFIGFGVLIWIAIVVGAVVVGGIAALTGAASAGPGIVIPLFLLVVAAGIYLWTRLMPLYPVIVVERRLDFRAALDLSRGNFWRLFGVSTLGALPIAIAYMIVFAVHARFALGGVGELARASPDPVRTVADAVEAYLLQVSIGGFVASMIGTGLGIPLICYSYKALKDIGPFEYLVEDGRPETRDA